MVCCLSDPFSIFVTPLPWQRSEDKAGKSMSTSQSFTPCDWPRYRHMTSAGPIRVSFSTSAGNGGTKALCCWIWTQRTSGSHLRPLKLGLFEKGVNTLETEPGGEKSWNVLTSLERYLCESYSEIAYWHEMVRSRISLSQFELHFLSLLTWKDS